MRKIEICISPALYPYYRLNNSIVVVIDIFRATSSFCVALSEGAKNIKTFALAKDALTYKNNPNYILAGERNGKKLSEFKLSNSPFDFIDNKQIKNKTIAFTTTNGTKAIELVKNDAKQVVTGAFLNKSSLVQWLINQQEDVLILCSGWKNAINYEDTLFAYELANDLLNNSNFKYITDVYKMAETIYNEGKEDLLAYIYEKSDRTNGRKEELGKDFEYCLQRDKFHSIPILKGEYLVNYEK